MNPRRIEWHDATDHEITQSGLTPLQLQAAYLARAGASERRIARMLGVSRTSVRDRLDLAESKIQRHRTEAA